MKRIAWLLLLPTLACAATREDYARQWPLSAPGDAGAYRVVLDRTVYRTIDTASLRDVAIVDADGHPVAADVFGPDAPLAEPPRRIDVPWFALQPRKGEGSASLALIAERDTTGRILSLHAQTGAAQDDGGARAFLFDLSQAPPGVDLLQLDWPRTSAIDAAYRVEASDDLQDWRTLEARVQLLALHNENSRLMKNTIVLRESSRYLRLVPLDDAPALPLVRARARVSTQTVETPLQWETLQGRMVRENNTTTFVYSLGGRFPVERADVQAPGNVAVEWRLESRDDDGAWRWRAGPWVAYRVGTSGRTSASPPTTVLDAPARDREWRLTATSGAPTQAPALRVGYRPEVVVFLAQGRAPYALVAGSAVAARADAPLPRLLQALRAERGDSWHPADATLGPAVELAGARALERPMTPRDWKQWLLWALLVGGAAVVAGFAISLLRKPPDAR
jgi:hypothetical protein